MTKGMIYKALFIAGITAFAVGLIMPTVGSKTMTISIEEGMTETVRAELSRRFKDGVSIQEEGGQFIVTGRMLSDADMNEARIVPGVIDATLERHWAEEILMAKKINLGLDLQGGMHLVMRANFENIEARMGEPLTENDRREVTQQALELLRNRIDRFGVSEPSIRPRGTEAIEIQLPGVRDPQAVKDAIGQTGRVEYRLVNDDFSTKAAEYLIGKSGKEAPAQGEVEQVIPDDINKAQELLTEIAWEIKLPDTLEVLYYYERDRDSGRVFPAYPIVLEKKVAIAGDDISRAWVGQDEYGGLSVQFTMTADGSAKFAEVTSAANRGRRLAVVIDNNVRSAPQINDQIATGQATITGNFSPDEVNTLARIIKEGALPVDLQIIEERTVGPSLGRDSIKSGVNAIAIGLAFVMVFMVIYFKASGIISVIGLVLNLVFMLALLSWLGFTLTLPGIAGIILTVGMAVDANVIIFERIKEELRSDKSVRLAVTNGFDRAFWTIVDANLTTIIAALILSQFGTGPIKGFAVTLLVGIISSMFVALYITRFIFEVLTYNRSQKKLSI